MGFHRLPALALPRLPRAVLSCSLNSSSSFSPPTCRVLTTYPLSHGGSLPAAVLLELVLVSGLQEGPRRPLQKARTGPPCHVASSHPHSPRIAQGSAENAEIVAFIRVRPPPSPPPRLRSPNARFLGSRRCRSQPRLRPHALSPRRYVTSAHSPSPSRAHLFCAQARASPQTTARPSSWPSAASRLNP